MNNFLVLDSNKYMAKASDWVPSSNPSTQIRTTLRGRTDVVFGPVVPRKWEGSIAVPVRPATGFGSMSDLRATIQKRQALSFTDHYGTSLNVVIQNNPDEKSLAPNWEAADNEIHVRLALIEVLA